MATAPAARRFAVAPMMEWTDRHCRFFHRLLTRRALIYTEMITTGAVIHGDRARLLAYDPAEHPLALHARKAWLKGLSPRENREVPPLDYERVFRLKVAHPRLAVVLNGGIASLDQAAAHLERLDGVMMGRAAYQEPWRLLAVDPLL